MVGHSIHIDIQNNIGRAAISADVRPRVTENTGRVVRSYIEDQASDGPSAVGADCVGATDSAVR